MPFDVVLGAGHEPRTQPAILIKTESIPYNNGAAIDITSTLDIPDNVAVQFYHITLTVKGQVDGHQPTVKLLRNDTEIDRLDWNQDFTWIASIITNRRDLLRQGDTISLNLSAPVTGGPGPLTITFNINVIGLYE